MFKSSRGLKRHCTISHSKTFPKSKGNIDVSLEHLTDNAPESILHPLQFKQMIHDASKNICKDGLYPPMITEELSTYKINITDVIQSYSYVRDIIIEYKGDAERFYSQFYTVVTKTNPFFKNMSRNSCTILGFEVANHVLAHMNNLLYQKDFIQQKSEKVSFTSKDKACIGYLAGYVFGTFYRRIRGSRKWQHEQSQQYLAFLLAGRSSVAEEELEAHRLLNARDRGGLWKPTKQVIKIFTLAEIHFHRKYAQTVHNVDCDEFVVELLQDNEIISIFSTICAEVNIKIPKEAAMNLFQDLLTLYTRVRAHSFAKDIKEKHLLAAKQQKAHSLRTELKKAQEDSM